MYEELIGKKVKVVLTVEVAENRPMIFYGLILTEGEDYLKIRDKFEQIQFIKKVNIATVGEVLR